MQGESNYNSGDSGQDKSGGVGNPGGSIQDAMDASRSKLANAYNTMQQRSNEMLQGAEGYIQNRPLQSMIYAASVGAVIGLVAGLLLGGAASDRSDGSWHRRFW